MGALITNIDVKNEAFTRDINENLIKDSAIRAAEWKFIRPILTQELYEDILTNPTNYTTLIQDYIKVPLAYYTRYMIQDDIAASTSDRGVTTMNGLNFNPASDKAKEFSKMQIVELANQHASILTNYVQKQEYAKYDGLEDTEIVSVGGFPIELCKENINTPNPSTTTTENLQARWITVGETIKLQYLKNGTWTDTGTEIDI